MMTFHNLTVPSPEFALSVHDLIKSHGGLIILDEVQTGFGRLGKWWGFEVTRWPRPDIVTCGKGLGNGIPVSVVLSSHKILKVCYTVDIC